VRKLPLETPIQLKICAVPAHENERQYEEGVRRQAAGDPRIQIDGPVPRSALPELLAASDALVVPSIWLETGPLVVLEARAAGLFVLGSRRGGIAELVDESDAGELVEAGNVDAWSAAIARLTVQHAKGGLPLPSRPVRTMQTAATEMASLYRSL
jgi:glycosyltransferase involved in cell wall biosynthesis